MMNIASGRSRSPPRATAAGAGPAPEARASLSHLLIVDDDLAVIEYLGQLLKGLAQISFATNGEDALRLARQQRPDLMLLDVELPGLGGFDVCRRLRATPGLHDLPVVFATAHVDADTRAQAMQLGAVDFLHKPFDDRQLLARLGAQLRAVAQPAPGAAAAPTRILIVDDDPTSIQLVRRLLADIGECHFALNGAQALALVGELRPDLILLDIDLPDSDGFDICRTLRADPALAQLAIMFLTQSSTLGHEARALALGGDDFVRKPFSAPVFHARVQRLVDRKRALQRHLGGADEAAAARRATASMLGYIAHEIGNPVNVIKGFSQLMQADKAAPLPPAQAAKLARILDAVDHLGGLLADVADVARMEAGQFPVELADVDLLALARQACEQTAAQAAAAGLVLVAPPPGPPAMARADARRLRQCLHNLLSNAVKYGNAGPGIEVEIQRRAAGLVLAVQDHGCGLGPGQLAQLFEPYNRLGRDGCGIPGTGLGLALTRKLVQAMGGQLLVHSQPGQGCRFEMLLQPGHL